MKFSIKNLIKSALLLLTLASFANAQQDGVAPQWREKANALFQNLDNAYMKEDIEGLMSLFDNDFAVIFLDINKNSFRSIFEDLFKKMTIVKVETKIKSTELFSKYLVVKTETYMKLKNEQGVEQDITDNDIYFIKLENDKLMIYSCANQLAPGEFDPVSRNFLSGKGKFGLTIPPKWYPLKSEQMGNIATENIVIAAEDMKSFVLLGFVQAPMTLDPKTASKQAADADEALAKKMMKDYVLIEQGDFKNDKISGYKTITEFSNNDIKRKRIRVYFYKDPFVYFFVCDAIPSEKFDTYKADFEKIINSFVISDSKNNATVSENIAAEYAKGSIAGNIYTNNEYNCFIAAPSNWTIRTSPNPAHLVEMQYKTGKSIARVIAAKDMKKLAGDLTIDAWCNQRVSELKNLTVDFKDVSKNNIQIQNIPAVESVLEYKLENFGNFKEKCIYIAKGDIFYLILCQAIEPDQYDALEKDFNEIIKSFGFIK